MFTLNCEDLALLLSVECGNPVQITGFPQMI